jgi:hypothetical protein
MHVSIAFFATGESDQRARAKRGMGAEVTAETSASRSSALVSVVTFAPMRRPKAAGPQCSGIGTTVSIRVDSRKSAA